MSELRQEMTTFVRETVQDIVSRGQDVRRKVAEVVSSTAAKWHLNPAGLIGLAQSALDGTVAAVDKSVPKDPDSVLRQVVDGLGDGISHAALVSRLALEEAEAQRKSFAAEDLTKLKTDLKAAGTLFVDTVTQGAGKFKTFAVAEHTALRDHAEKTRQRLQPALEAALVAAAHHPIQFGKESVGAGVALSRQALGALFETAGRTMQYAGKKLTGEEPAP